MNFTKEKDSNYAQQYMSDITINMCMKMSTSFTNKRKIVEKRTYVQNYVMYFITLEDFKI